MKLIIDNDLYLEVLHANLAVPLFHLIQANRSYLREYLNWLDNMNEISSLEEYIKGSLQRWEQNIEAPFTIFYKSEIVGRIGIGKLDHYNKMGEIGYWLAAKYQGNGIMTKACKAIMDYAFTELFLNRIEIKCATPNLKSRAIPVRLGFKHEGTLRQAEWLYNRFIDLELYAFCKNDL